MDCHSTLGQALQWSHRHRLPSLKKEGVSKLIFTAQLLVAFREMHQTPLVRFAWNWCARYVMSGVRNSVWISPYLKMEASGQDMLYSAVVGSRINRFLIIMAQDAHTYGQWALGSRNYDCQMLNLYCTCQSPIRPSQCLPTGLVKFAIIASQLKFYLAAWVSVCDADVTDIFSVMIYFGSLKYQCN